MEGNLWFPELYNRWSKFAKMLANALVRLESKLSANTTSMLLFVTVVRFFML